MSGQVELAQQYERLQEISSIMTAMKSLALVETQKLSHMIEHQRLMLSNIEMAAADFQSFFSIKPYIKTQPAILIIIGSERGFCGNFNERLIDTLSSLHDIDTTQMQLLIVGSRLSAKLPKHSSIIAQLAGPTVTEEVPDVLNRIIENLNALSGTVLYILAHKAEGEPILKKIIPYEPLPKTHFTNPPSLQLTPGEFFSEMLDQYLLAVLYGVLYESLAAESHQRLAHMEQALDHLDENIAKLTIKRNAIRQEKIIEEIEMILSRNKDLNSLDQ